MPAAALSSLHTASIDGTSKSSTRFHTAEMRVPHSVTYTYSNQTEVSDMVSILTMVGKGRPTTRTRANWAPAWKEKSSSASQPPTDQAPKLLQTRLSPHCTSRCDTHHLPSGIHVQRPGPQLSVISTGSQTSDSLLAPICGASTEASGGFWLSQRPPKPANPRTWASKQRWTLRGSAPWPGCGSQVNTYSTGLKVHLVLGPDTRRNPC